MTTLCTLSIYTTCFSWWQLTFGIYNLRINVVLSRLFTLKQLMTTRILLMRMNLIFSHSKRSVKQSKWFYSKYLLTTTATYLNDQLGFSIRGFQLYWYKKFVFFFSLVLQIIIWMQIFCSHLYIKWIGRQTNKKSFLYAASERSFEWICIFNMCSVHVGCP